MLYVAGGGTTAFVLGDKRDMGAMGKLSDKLLRNVFPGDGIGSALLSVSSSIIAKTRNEYIC